MDATIQIRQRGSLTLPVELRERYGIEAGDTFRILDLDVIFVLDTHDAGGSGTGTGNRTGAT